MTEAHALEVQTLFRGVLIGTKHVPRTHRKRKQPLFVIGSTARADAPVAAEYLARAPGGPTSHALVDRGDDEGRYLVRVTPRMTGVVSNDNGTTALPARAANEADGVDDDATFTLRTGDRARIECGAVTFLLAATTRAPLVAAPRIDWRSHEHRYHLVTALGVAAFLLMLRATPADPRSLSLDLLARERSIGSYLIKPPVPPPAPADPSAKKALADDAPAGRRAPGQAGEAGRPTARDVNRRYAIRKRADKLDFRLPPDVEAEILNAGMLGQLKRSTAMSSIFSRDSPFGSEAEDILGSLVGTTIGDARGHGGLGANGTGSGGGDTGARVLDSQPGLGTFGVAGGHDGWRRGVAVGTLGPRHATHLPTISAEPPHVWGSLDREIIRRIIRRHINEVKFCYEQGLTTQAKLGGRLLVRFMIAASGQVITSVVESSTLGNARVESCTVQAVRRWEFPRPIGGGLVTVSYPFVLAPAGGAE